MNKGIYPYDLNLFRHHVEGSKKEVLNIEGDDKDSDLKRVNEYLHIAVLYWLRAIAPPKSAT